MIASFRTSNYSRAALALLFLTPARFSAGHEDELGNDRTGQELERLSRMKALELSDPQALSTGDLVELGRLRQFYEGDYDGASANAEAAIQRSMTETGTTSTSALFLSALGKKQKGRVAEAAVVYKQLLALAPEDPLVLREVASTSFNIPGMSKEQYLTDVIGNATTLTQVHDHRENWLLLARAYRHGRELFPSPYGAPIPDPTNAYEECIADPRTPLVVYVEYADYLQGAGACEDAIAVLQAALALRPETFPPEWRIRLATLRKFVEGEEAGREEFNATIGDIRRHMAVTLPSANLYALKAYCEMELGQEVRKGPSTGPM